MAVQTQFQFRRGTAAEWSSSNPILASGEFGYETDTGRAKVGNGTSTWSALMYSLVPVQAQSTPTFTSNAYTLVATDANLLLAASNGATSGTINIPTDVSVNFAIGTQISILQVGTGQITITATTPGTTTIRSTGSATASPKLRTQYSAATLWKQAANLWYVFGDIS